MANPAEDFPSAPPDQSPGQNALLSGKQSVPAPTHEQTATALRHFRIVRNALRKLLENPDLGKTNIRPEMIDAMTGLIGDGIMEPANAVTQLSKLPDKPFDQKQAVEQMYADTIRAEIAVLDHHKTTNPPQYSEFALEHLRHVASGREHVHVMKGLMAHYAR